MKQLPGFSISRLANGEDFFNIYIFLKVNIYVSINDYLFKYIYLVCYLKFCFYCLTCSVMLNLNSSDFATPNSHHRILIVKIEMLLEFQSKTNIEIIGF